MLVAGVPPAGREARFVRRISIARERWFAIRVSVETLRVRLGPRRAVEQRAREVRPQEVGRTLRAPVEHALAREGRRAVRGATLVPAGRVVRQEELRVARWVNL